MNYSTIKNNENRQFEVIEKDKLIMEDTFDASQMSAFRHANGKDWWLIQQNIESDQLFIYLISDLGVRLEHTVDSQIRLPIGISLSQVAFSPDGTKYGISSSEYIDNKISQEISLFNFNRCSGNLELISIDTIENKRLFAILAFSPSGRYLNASTYETMYQYDLAEEDWVSSRLPNAEYDGFFFEYNEFTGKQETKLGPLALAPDGRIYSVPPGNQRYLHTIEYPDERGEEANVIQHKIKIPTLNFRSIPNFPFYRLGPEDGSPCNTLGLDNHCVTQFRYAQDTMDHLKVRFTAISYFRPENWSWDFGDGTTYEGNKPYFHTFPEDGVYHVCLTVSNENGQDKYCKDLFLGVTSTEQPKLNRSQVNLFPNPVDASPVYQVAQAEEALSIYYGKADEADQIRTLTETYLSDPSNQQQALQDIESISTTISDRQPSILSSVNSILSSISPSNDYEALFQDIYTVYTAHLSDPDLILSFQELQIISEAANLCPLTYGPSIYIAQSLADQFGINYDEANCSDIRTRRDNAKVDFKANVFPNPASNHINILSENMIYANILTLNGQLISKSITNQVDLSSLNNGLYLLEVITSDGKEYHKVIINR